MSEFFSAIDSVPPVISAKKLALKVARLAPSLSSEDLDLILSALLSLSAVRVLNKVPIQSFLDDVCESLEKRPEVDAVVLRSRLDQLLQAESIVLASKASAIQREHPNVLVNAKILTDLRPVFGDSPEALQGAMVVHNLKVTCLQANQAQEIFFALDDEDLAMLQKVIARAEAKSKVLLSFIEKSGLPNLDPAQD